MFKNIDSICIHWPLYDFILFEGFNSKDKTKIKTNFATHGSEGKLPPFIVPSHKGESVRESAALLIIQLPIVALGKATKNSPNAWAAVTHTVYLKGVPAAWLLPSPVLTTAANLGDGTHLPIS